MENPLEIKEGRKNLERNINFKNPLIVRVVMMNTEKYML